MKEKFRIVRSYRGTYICEKGWITIFGREKWDLMYEGMAYSPSIFVTIEEAREAIKNYKHRDEVVEYGL